VADVLIYADSLRSPEMRHEVPLAVPDPFLYAEHEGSRHVVASSFELDRIKVVGPDLELMPYEEFGLDELYAQGLSRDEIELEVVLRAARRFGIERAAVPSTFPLEVADHLRANGIEVTADREHFVRRRRVKNEAELAGIRRAQHAAEAGMTAARELLRAAERQNGELVLQGEPLTCERLKMAVEQAFTANGAFADEFIVSHGPQTAVGHEVHEEPSLGRAPGELVAGDVIAMEPGLYRNGYGGCRLEDIVLVTEKGPEVLTDYPYDLRP
jgi:Xaa-Pro aminopeptidase